MAYKIPFTKEQKDKLSEIGSKKKIKNAGSVLAYITKYANKETGYLEFSIEKLYSKYVKDTKKYKMLKGEKKPPISLAYFKNLANLLFDIGILKIKKKGKNGRFKFYGIEEFEKKEKDDKITLENKENETIDKLANEYKGIGYNVKATKNDLKKIAKALLVKMELNSKSVHDKCVQWLVFKKIKFSLQKINLVGAVKYIKKIINEKMKEVKSSDFKVPPWLLNDNTNKANFTQREYEDDYLKYIEECHQKFWENGMALI
ncbi:hypothetical protein [Clostridium perfringens]|uniref:hypothetical protein n=1 Tax=Clostridium perfringens TaxID=1502 RepID=UPI0024BCF7A0|nr:hypothetical protein [Clostridium perfringens]